MWRGYQLKEAGREIFAGDLEPTEAIALIDRWCSRAQRSRLAPFVKAAATVRKHRDGILAAIRYGLSNGLIEGLILWSLAVGCSRRDRQGFSGKTSSCRRRVLWSA